MMSNELKQTIITFLTIFIVVIIGFIYIINSKEKKIEEEMQETVAFKVLSETETSSPYTDLEGKSVLLEDYVGKTLVINSWASWNPDSVTSLKNFAAVELNGDLADVVVLAINRSEPKETAKTFLQAYEIDGLIFVLDPDDRYYKSIGGQDMPETVFYNKDGEVVHHTRGVLTKSEIIKYIDDALESGL